MRRPAVLALLVLVALAPVLPTAAAVPDARLTVSDVTVEPDTPVTDSPTTVTVTVNNGAGSPQPATVDRVALVTGSGGALAAAEGVGALGAGGSLTVPLTTTFDRPGEKSLFVVVEGTDEDGDSVTVRRPVTVVVESAPPLVELRPGRTVVDAQSRTVVELSNPTTDAMRNVVVTLEGPGEAVIERRTVASLAAGAATTVNFTSVPRSAGSADLEATVRYTTAVGTQRTVSRSATVEVAPMNADVGVRVQRADQPGQQQQQLQVGGQIGQLLGAGGTTTQQDEEGAESEARQVSVVVTNFGNAPVDDVVVTPTVGDLTLPRQSLGGSLAPGESASVVVPLGSVEQAGEVTFDVAYRAGTRDGTAAGRFDYRPPQGSVRITGVELSFTEDGRLQVSGNAGNIGRGEVTGLVVSVGDTEHVRPAYPQRDYFVGTVEGSEFAPFDLTAEVDADNATTVPVRVSYVVNGVERTQTVELPYDTSLEQPERREGIRLPFGGLGIALAALVCVPAVALLYRYR
jgi:hypothetical protein